jgi:hypothetical protein
MAIETTTDLSGVLQGIETLIELVYEGAENGLVNASAYAQSLLEGTIRHGDITGATRASYRVFLIGGSHNGSAESSSGYADAQAAIAAYGARGFQGHGGQALSQDSGITLTPQQRGLLYTSYTDYQEKLETENGAQKATLLPTLLETMQLNTEDAANGIKALL